MASFSPTLLLGRASASNRGDRSIAARHVFRVGVVLAVVGLRAATAVGQCEWTAGLSGFLGVDGQVNATAVFNDGGGDALYIGGSFTIAGDAFASNIAKWNGSSWSALGSGMNGSVEALTVFDDGGGPALYAGGLFTTVGGVSANGIAKWNGSSWSALGSGVGGGVYALTVFDDGSGAALYAGGSLGGMSANNIAKWNGSSWSPLGLGVGGTAETPYVFALTVFDDGGGPALYAGGTFNTAGGAGALRIAKWNGSSWSPLGSGVGGYVEALTVFDDGGGPALYAGGTLLTAGGVSANRIAKWNGSSWSALGSGMNNLVFALSVFDDGGGPALYAGGWFNIAGGVSANGIAKWNGSTWSALGSGTGFVYALTVFDDGGGPALYAGSAKWNGSSWSALGSGLDNVVFALTGFDDGGGPALYAGGEFTTAGGVSANHIAKWNGSSWSPLGSGMDGSGVYALTVFDDGGGAALHAGGYFTTAGGVSASRIAKWNGSSWSDLGSGMSGGVTALTVFDDGTGPALYAGGGFTTAGGVSANNIAKWNGSSWSALGSGMSGGVTALTVFDDGGGPALYAGGGFTTAGGVSANYIAKWNGSSWSALGTGMDGPVYSLAVFDDGGGPALYAGGEFFSAGGVSANFIAKWDGSIWSDLGSGMDGFVRALAVYDDGGGPALYAGGDFTTAGGEFAPTIAKWKGSIWDHLGTGIDAFFVSALGVFNDGGGPALFAGGNIILAGGVVSRYIAKWNCAPLIDCNHNGIQDADDIANLTSPDCNGNGIPDECDIADCAGDPACDDCNLNGVLDGCDITGATSLDVEAPFGVPDECSSPSAGGNWTDDIWGLPGPNPYPDTVAAAPNRHVTLRIPPAQATAGTLSILLNTDATIDTLRMLEGTTLRVTESGSAGDLTVADPLGVVHGGTLWVANDRTIDVLAGSFHMIPGSAYEMEPPATGASSARLAAPSVRLDGDDAGLLSGARIELRDAMEVSVSGDFVMKGSAAAAQSTASTALGITPPPELRLFDGSRLMIGGTLTMTAALESVNQSTVDILLGGDFQNKAVLPSLFDWTVGGLLLNGGGLQAIEVAGINLGQTEQGYQTDADTLFDANPHTNFSIGRLEVPSAGMVRFENTFANTVGSGPCDEGLYVDSLILRSGAQVTFDNVRVYYRSLIDEGATITNSGCGDLQDVASPTPNIDWDVDPLSAERTSRSLRFRVPQPAPATATAGQSAIRVTMIDLMHPDPRNLTQYPPPNYSTFDTGTHGTCAGATTSPNYNGHHCAADAECLGPNGAITTDDGTCSVGPACTAIGETNPPTANGIGGCARWVGKPWTFYESQGPPQSGPYRASRLECVPVYWDWASEPDGGLVTVVGAEIVPSSEYSAQTYGASCKGNEDTCTNVSTPVTMFTRRKGDLDSPYQAPSPAALTQADVLDISQAVASVKHTGPPHYRGQMQPNLPELNADANVLDIVEAVDSVKRTAYSFSGPCVCPSTVTCGGSCTGCTGMCVKTCAGGDNDGEPCINNTHCPGVCSGGTNPGAVCPSGVPGGANCVGTCVGGGNPGAACTNPGTQCTGGGVCSGQCSGACGAAGTCYDKCGRCSP